MIKQSILIQGPATVDVYHLVACMTCAPPRPIPFAIVEERTAWILEHVVSTGHKVDIATEIRIAI